MKSIGVGVIGTGFMGKAHSIAYSSSASVFGTSLRPKLEIVCDLSPSRAKNRATDLGFARYTDKWQEVVNDPKVDLYLADTLSLATRIPSLSGTPFFIIGDNLIPGADEERLNAALQDILDKT